MEGLKDIRSVEVLAKKRYEDDELTFHNFTITDPIALIIDDEIRHIAILDKLISLLEP